MHCVRHDFVHLVCQQVRRLQPYRQVPGTLGNYWKTCLEEINQNALSYQQVGAAGLALTAPFYFSVCASHGTRRRFTVPGDSYIFPTWFVDLQQACMRLRQEAK